MSRKLINTKHHAIDSIFGLCDLHGIKVEKEGDYFYFTKNEKELQLHRQLNFIQIVVKLSTAFNVDFNN